MKIKKTGYYIRSLLILFRLLRNPFILAIIPLRKSTVLHLKNGMRLEVRTLLDCLIIKETIADDTYRIRQLKKPGVIVDIGGGLGEFAVFVARQHPGATVLSFEPNPSFFKMLKANIKRNKTRNIQAKRIGIGKKAQKKALQLGNEFAKGSLFRRTDEQTKRTLNITIKPLHTFLKKPVDLIKIDCEGAEWEILKGLSVKAFRKVHAIALEYHRHAKPDMDTSLSDLLKQYGFNVRLHPDPYDAQIGYLYAHKSKTGTKRYASV